LRHGRIFTGADHWTRAHRRWLADQSFGHPAQQIVFQDSVAAIEDALERLRRLDGQLASIVPSWSMAPVVAAYQAMRGVSFLVAVTFAAEIGDVRRFDTPRQLMSFLGLVPAERSTGDKVRRTGLTLAGNRRTRRVLVEAAWSYRHPARVSNTQRARVEPLPKQFATSHGRRKSGCAAGIASSAPPARGSPSSSPPSHARWRRSYGRSAARSLQHPDLTPSSSCAAA
jgi:transposase